MMGENDPMLFEDLTPSKDGGIIKTIIKRCENEDDIETPFDGAKVYVHYVGRFLSGEKFDSSKDRNEVFSFIAGRNSVIKGWDIGVLSMRKNEIAEFRIAPEYGYGKEGFPPKIPENCTLLFEVELLGWDDEEVTLDGGVRKKVRKMGSGVNKPNLDSHVKIHLRGSYKGRLFDERDVEFRIGEGYEFGIVDGVEKAICKMRIHERATVFVRNDYAYRDVGNDLFQIPPDAENIEYEINLFRFEREFKEIYEMDYEERLQRSEKLKEFGAKCLKAGEYEKAIIYYKRILKMVKINKEDSDYVLGLPFKIASFLNMALCYLKQQDYHNAKLQCEKVLKHHSDNMKALFRLGEANMGLEEYSLAMKAYESALTVEPKNTVVRKQLERAKLSLKSQINKEKQLYSKIFSLQ